ncbi:MAG: L,D-transpeptidase [Armatimonadetes bacterium]|nr:L,D-transpeptidase [Armatimonadota bacterium]
MLSRWRFLLRSDGFMGDVALSSSNSAWCRSIPWCIGFTMFVGTGAFTLAYAGGDIKFQSGAPAQQGIPATTVPATPPAPTRKLLDPLTAITFADESGTTYVIARKAADYLGLNIDVSDDGKTLTIGDQLLTQFRRTYNGQTLLAVHDLAKLGGTLYPNPETHELTVVTDESEFKVVVGKKRVEVDQGEQELVGYQGDIVVIRTNVSTGRPGHHTPNGEFVTGPKERMHYSHKYENAPMPYAIQVNGDVFFHGYSSVPPYPASHGCVRIPLSHKNPARYLYHWLESGVDAKISGTYSWENRSRKRKGGD